MSKFRQSSERISRSSFKIESTGRKHRDQGFGCKTAQHEREETEGATLKKKLRNVDWNREIRKGET